MMRLEYAGGEILVSDALCHALLSYSAAIARIGGSEDLQIPVLTVDGVRGTAEVVIGPASQLLATPTTEPDVDLHDDDLVTDLAEWTARLHPPKPIAVEPDGDEREFDDLL